MSKINFREANEMYANGMSYAAIGRYYGVTRQYVKQFMESDTLRTYRKRKESNIYKQIVYYGFKRLFEDDQKLTIPKLARMLFGYSDTAVSNKLARIMTGKNVAIEKNLVDKLLELSGMSYEAFFRKIDK